MDSVHILSPNAYGPETGEIIEKKIPEIFNGSIKKRPDLYKINLIYFYLYRKNMVIFCNPASNIHVLLVLFTELPYHIFTKLLIFLLSGECPSFFRGLGCVESWGK